MKIAGLQTSAWAMAAAGALTAAAAGGGQDIAAVTKTVSSDETSAAADPSSGPKHFQWAFGSEDAKKHADPVTWLGVGVEETTGALSSQLGLKQGEGLVVSFVAPDSPAEKAQLAPNDVLVDMDGQMLVDPAQLRKLVHMHPDGDTVKLTLYRGGRKQTVSAKLAKTNPKQDSSLDSKSPFGLADLKLELAGMKDGGFNFATIWTNHGVDNGKLNQEIRIAVENAQKAAQDAMKEAYPGHGAGRTQDPDLDALAGAGMGVGKDATIIVKKDRNSVKTVVQSDDKGSYVLMANPRKHLTVHDKHGKLLFDGEIETPDQQKKVPRDVWEKVKPMLEQLEPDATEKSDGDDK